MRRIDATIGPALCAALTVGRRLSDPFRRGPTDAPKRIVIIKLAEQGATVVANTALRRATAMVGADNVFMVVFEENRFVLDELGLIPEHNVVTVRSTEGIGVFVRDLLAAVRRMRSERVDVAIDFEFFARSSAILAYLSGARTRVGLHSYFGEGAYRGDLMTHRVAANAHLHAADLFRVLVDVVLVDPAMLPALPLAEVADEAPVEIRPTAGEVATVRRIVVEALAGRAFAPLVLLNANAGDLLPLRRWPADRYVELARRFLAAYPDAVIGLTGAPSEAAAASEIVAAVDSDRCVSLAGRTTLRQLLVLYGLAEVLVTNDSGPAHYAMLTPIDVVTLFGPETPAVFGARSPRSHYIRANVPCSPCVNLFNDRQTKCTDNVCMQRITVDDVLDETSRVFQRRVSGESASCPAGS